MVTTLAAENTDLRRRIRQTEKKLTELEKLIRAALNLSQWRNGKKNLNQTVGPIT